MVVKLVLEGELVTFVSVYAPQVSWPHGRNLSNESSGAFEVASHREENAESGLWSDIEC